MDTGELVCSEWRVDFRIGLWFTEGRLPEGGVSMLS